MLSLAVANRLDSFQPPVDPKDFEKLCVDVFEFILKAHKIPILNRSHNRIKAFGVSGDGQSGVDIRDPATLAVGQCKRQEVITKRHLERELELLLDYDEPVSHYFFLISRDGVKRSLIEWVDEQNLKSRAARAASTPYPCLPSVALPNLHILGWEEIRSYLGQSQFLLWKWQVSAPVGQHFHLESYDLSALDQYVRRHKMKVDSDVRISSLEILHAIESLTEHIDIKRLRSVGKSSLVDVEIIDDVSGFVQGMKDTFGVINKYDDAIAKIDKLDGVVAEEGYFLLNDLFKHKARIGAYPYLRRLFFDCRSLLRILNAYESWEPHTEWAEYDGEWHELQDDQVRRYNFENKKPGCRPMYTNPKELSALVKKIAVELAAIRSYQ